MGRIAIAVVTLAGCTLEPIVDTERSSDPTEAPCREVASYTFVSRGWGAPARPTVYACGGAIEVTCADGEHATLLPSPVLSCGPNVSTFAARDRRTCRATGTLEVSAACSNSWGSVVYTATDTASAAR